MILQKPIFKFLYSLLKGMNISLILMMLMFCLAWIDYNDFVLDSELALNKESKAHPFSLNHTKNDMLNRRIDQMFYLFDQQAFGLYIQQCAT